MLLRPRTAWLAGLLVWAWAGPAAGLVIKDYISPRDRERPARPYTRYIILHTTEGNDRALGKLYRNGEAHYLVTRNGVVYRIVRQNKVAYHSGRSMWEGRSGIDNHALGIEVVGYHNKTITPAQTVALRDLLTQLQTRYGVPDDKVLTHSMVAYGNPNPWHKKPHRGRKRCGMLFARRDLRRQLGLTSQPSYDPDVRAKRLVVGDPYLASVLYGNVAEQASALTRLTSTAAGPNVITRGQSAWDVAGDDYNDPQTRYIFPDGREQSGAEIKDWTAMPIGTRVVLPDEACPEDASPAAGSAGAAPAGLRTVGAGGATVQSIAGAEYNRASTIYFLPGGKVARGDELGAAALQVPAQTQVLAGYTHGGYITARRSAYDICQERWNAATTLYRFPDGRLVPGSRVPEGSIPQNTMVFFVP